MSETIRLEFRRGGKDLSLEAGRLYFARRHGGHEPPTLYVPPSPLSGTNAAMEYAGPFTLEIVEPEPKLLRIPWCDEPAIFEGCKGWLCQSRYSDGYACVFVTSPARRGAIEAYNAAAKAILQAAAVPEYEEGKRG